MLCWIPFSEPGKAWKYVRADRTASVLATAKYWRPVDVPALELLSAPSHSSRPSNLRRRSLSGHQAMQAGSLQPRLD